MDIPGIEDLRPVAHGGFGVVYRGRQPAFNRDVAVKVVTTDGIDEAVRRRFERECQALGVLSDHPNIVGVHAAGSLATGEPYMVMPFLESGSYQDHIDTGGPIHWRDAVDVIIKIAHALEVAHQQGIVHCDVKPANILRSRFGEPELSDFGIARLAAAGASTSSAQSFTPNFVAPEVFNDVEPEPSRDIYALGATFIALVTGEPPFRSTTGEILALIAAVASQRPPDLRPLGIPDAVCQVIEATMAKAPHERPQSAVILAGLLSQAANETVVSSPTRSALAPNPPPSHLQTVEARFANQIGPGADPPPAATITHTHKRKGRLGLVPAILGLMVAVAVAWALAFRGDGGTAESSATSLQETPVPAISTTLDPPSTTLLTDIETVTTLTLPAPIPPPTAPPTTAAATTVVPTTAPPTTVAPTTAVPSTAVPTTVPLRIVDVRVVRTCGASGNGDCFLSLRRSPTSRSAEVSRLSEGAAISLECQTRGESVKSSLLSASTDVWSRTLSGLFVSSAFLDGPDVDPFTITLPPCA